jgi:hypothetical protein
MGGYDRKAHAKVFLLKFEDEEMAGLEVRVRTTSMAGMTSMAKLSGLANGREITAEDIDQLDPLFDLFVSCLESWNLEDDGEPVPITKAALLEQDLDFTLSLISAWIEAAAGVAAPLEERSNAGGLSLAGSIPMDTLSPSLAS